MPVPLKDQVALLIRFVHEDIVQFATLLIPFIQLSKTIYFYRFWITFEMECSFADTADQKPGTVTSIYSEGSEDNQAQISTKHIHGQEAVPRLGREAHPWGSAWHMTLDISEKRSKPWVKPSPNTTVPQLSCSHSSERSPRITSLPSATAQMEQLDSWGRTGGPEPAVCTSLVLNQWNTDAACQLGFSGSSPARWHKSWVPPGLHWGSGVRWPCFPLPRPAPVPAFHPHHNRTASLHLPGPWKLPIPTGAVSPTLIVKINGN